MSFVFRLPDVGEGIHEAEIVEILVAVGDAVKEDQDIFKIETDKAVVSLPAPATGKVLEISCKVGDVVEVGDPLIVLATDEQTTETPPKAAATPPEKQKAMEQEAAAPAQPLPAHKRALATPHTRQLARKLGVDINAVKGSGKNGRITDEDVERAAAVDTRAGEKVIEQKAAEPQGGKHTVEEFGPVQRIPFKGIRKKTAEAMRESVGTIPHVWHAEDVDVTALFDVAKQQRADAEEQGVKLTPLAFVVRAVVSALKKFPEVNSSLDEANSEIILKEYYHIGIATDTEHGLIVPVIRDADTKSILHIAREIQLLAEKARAREIELQQLKGATFSITNVGVLGGVYATPIIPPPQAAILALMAARQKPVVVDDKVEIRRIMPLVLAFDHRILDGAMMARFMNHIKNLLENPMRMLIEMS